MADAERSNGGKKADGEEHEEMRTGVDRRKRLIRAGLFSLIGLVILVVAIFVIGDKQNLFSSTFPVYAHFETVEGLKSGALVTVNGIKVGTVAGVTLKMNPEKGSYVRVDMTIDASYHEFVRTSTVAVVSQSGLIGEKLVELRVTNPTAPLANAGAQLPSEEPVNYTAILDEAREAVGNTESITASLDTLLLRFRRGEGTLGKFLTNDEAYEGLVRVTNSAERLMNQTGRELADITGTLSSAARNVDVATVEVQRLISDIGSGKGTFGALMYDRSVYDSLEQVLGSLNRAASDAGFAAREFGINMRGLRQNWLVGGLFNGGEDVETQAAQQARALEIMREELRLQRELLEKRERELMNVEQKQSMKVE